MVFLDENNNAHNYTSIYFVCICVCICRETYWGRKKRMILWPQRRESKNQYEESRYNLDFPEIFSFFLFNFTFGFLSLLRFYIKKTCLVFWVSIQWDIFSFLVINYCVVIIWIYFINSLYIKDLLRDIFRFLDLLLNCCNDKMFINFCWGQNLCFNFFTIISN